MKITCNYVPTMKQLTTNSRDCRGVWLKPNSRVVDVERSCRGCSKCAPVYMAIIAEAYDQIKQEDLRLDVY